MRFNTLSLSAKLWLSLVLIIGSILTVLAIFLTRANGIQAQGRALVTAVAQQAQAAQSWKALAETHAARVHSLLLTSDAAMEAEIRSALDATSARIDEVRKGVAASTGPQSDAIDQAVRTYTAAFGQALQLKSGGDVLAAQAAIRNALAPAAAAYLRAVGELVDQGQQRIEAAQLEVETARVANLRVAVLLILGLLAAIGVGAGALIRSIRLAIRDAVGLAQRIGAGDLSGRVEVTRGDEFGDLMRSMLGMNESLCRMVSQVQHSIDSIATASSQIAAGNNDLASRTEQTSSRLQSTASSMDQLASAVGQSTANAGKARDLATSTSGVAEKGGQVVQGVVATMDEIKSSSQRITDIIGVIDGIAFQTNILALNAAVEAARAGEQGRGFAVVASEVRSLAGRAAAAAREVKSLIGASVERVDAGTSLVDDAGSSMREIVQAVRQVTGMVSEISSAAEQQSAGIAGINVSLAELDHMTQQNAALVEQSAAATESLRHQADELARAISVFKLA